MVVEGKERAVNDGARKINTMKKVKRYTIVPCSEGKGRCERSITGDKT